MIFVGPLLCALGFHRQLHVGTTRIGSGSISFGMHVECSRCGVPLDYRGIPIEKKPDNARPTR
jgi:hypothetical protein